MCFGEWLRPIASILRQPQMYAASRLSRGSMYIWAVLRVANEDVAVENAHGRLMANGSVLRC